MKKMFAMKRFMKLSLVFALTSLLVYSYFAINIGAFSLYVGTNKGGAQTGIQANIKPMTSYPDVTGSGESCWVSNVSGTGNNKQWVQTGIRYLDKPIYQDGYRTYLETKISGVHNRTEISYCYLDDNYLYKVEYQLDNKWHAYIDGNEQGSYTLPFSSAAVQAQAEAHSSTIDMGPFMFSNVKYKNSSNNWVYMDVTPTADYPFSVNIINSHTYRAYR